MAEKRRVLFLCTGNACRSQMAQAILRHVGGDRFDALSAGSHPAGFVHGLAIGAMKRLQVPIGEPRSKGWDEFKDSAVAAVITLCDDAARETCPVWPGDPIKTHWSIPDPVVHMGTEEERMEVAVRIAERLRIKIEQLVALDWSMSPAELTRQLERLGEI